MLADRDSFRTFAAVNRTESRKVRRAGTYVCAVLAMALTLMVGACGKEDEEIRFRAPDGYAEAAEAKEVRDRIEGTLRATRRANIEKVITYMEGNGYFTVSCSSHHRYEGGMADHAWQTYQLALRSEEEYRKTHNTVTDRASIAICALLHDFCDCRGMDDIGGHGWRSAEMIKSLGVALTDDEWLAIRFHMSLDSHTSDARYPDALHSHLRSLIHSSDTSSASLGSGSEIP